MLKNDKENLVSLYIIVVLWENYNYYLLYKVLIQQIKSVITLNR